MYNFTTYGSFQFQQDLRKNSLKKLIQFIIIGHSQFYDFMVQTVNNTNKSNHQLKSKKQVQVKFSKVVELHQDSNQAVGHLDIGTQ